MPLLKGKENIGHNIEVEQEHGKPHKQAVAIALRTAGVPKVKDGMYSEKAELLRKQIKTLENRLDNPPANASDAWYMRQEQQLTTLRKRLREEASANDVLPITDDHEEEGFEHPHARPRKPQPHEDVRDMDVKPIDTETKLAVAKHNAGLTKSQDRGAKDKAPFVENRALTDLAEKVQRMYLAAPNTREGIDAVKAEMRKVIAAAGTTPEKLADYITKMSTHLGRRSNVNHIKNLARDTDLVQPIRVDPVPMPSGERNERGWFTDGKDVSVMAPKAEQFTNGARVHNSKGSVGEVVHVKGNVVIVSVDGRREEWPLEKTFRAGGAEDGIGNKPHLYNPKPSGHGGFTEGAKCAFCGLKKDAPIHKASVVRDEVLPIGEDVDITYKRATPPVNPKPIQSFAHSPEEIKKIYEPKDPGGFKKQFGKDGDYTFKQEGKLIRRSDGLLSDDPILGIKRHPELWPPKAGSVKDGYAETYAAARQRVGQVKPIPLGPAPEPDTLKEVERRAKDGQFGPKGPRRVPNNYASAYPKGQVLKGPAFGNEVEGGPGKKAKDEDYGPYAQEVHSAKAQLNAAEKRLREINNKRPRVQGSYEIAYDRYLEAKRKYEVALGKARGTHSGDAEVKPIRVNPAPVAKTVPVSKAKHVKDAHQGWYGKNGAPVCPKCGSTQVYSYGGSGQSATTTTLKCEGCGASSSSHQAKDTAPAGNVLMRSGGKLEMAGKYDDALAEYKKALEAFKKDRDGTGVRDAEQAIYEMERKSRYEHQTRKSYDSVRPISVGA